jgi:hypothetical protein
MSAKLMRRASEWAVAGDSAHSRKTYKGLKTKLLTPTITVGTPRKTKGFHSGKWPALRFSETKWSRGYTPSATSLITTLWIGLACVTCWLHGLQAWR